VSTAYSLWAAPSVTSVAVKVVVPFVSGPAPVESTTVALTTAVGSLRVPSIVKLDPAMFAPSSGQRTVIVGVGAAAVTL